MHINFVVVTNHVQYFEYTLLIYTRSGEVGRSGKLGGIQARDATAYGAAQRSLCHCVGSVPGKVR